MEHLEVVSKEEIMDDDSSSQTGSTASATRAAKAKKKVKVESTNSKPKDHLNIVFIGHVGELIFIYNYYSDFSFSFQRFQMLVNQQLEVTLCTSFNLPSVFVMLHFSLF